MLRAFKNEPSHQLPTGLVPPLAQPLAEACSRGDPLVPVLQRIVIGLGFEHFMYAVGASPHPTQQTRSYVWTSLPAEWVRLYDDRAYVEVDPRLSWAWNSNLPVVWDQSTIADEPRIRGFFAAARTYGIASGVVFALRTKFEAPGVFTLSSSLPDVDTDRAELLGTILSQTMALGTYVHDLFMASVIAQLLPPPNEERPLSRREQQCLQLAAAGRTSRQIGDELSIGERTVHTHFANLLGKLGAANRHEAIAIGSRAGLITTG